MRTAISKFALAASVALASACIFSCSNGGDEGGNSSPSGGGGGGGTNGGIIVTDVYDIEQQDGSTLHLARDGAENCQEDGTLKREKDYRLDLDYLVSDNSLSISWNGGWEGDEPIAFSGSSGQLIGTWTREKDMDASCRLTQGIDESWIRCDEGYDIIKAVFTQSTATFTHDVCLTDYGNTNPPPGWTSRVADCSSVEYSRGNDKVTVRMNPANGLDYLDDEFWYVYTLNGKVCEYHFAASIAEKEQACASAIIRAKEEEGEYWREYLQDYYRDNVYNFDEFMRCLENKGFPREFWGYYYDTPEAYKALPKNLTFNQGVSQ